MVSMRNNKNYHQILPFLLAADMFSLVLKVFGTCSVDWNKF